MRSTFNKFPDFFLYRFLYCRIHLKIQYVIAIRLMISASNEPIQQQLEYTLLKTDCHSWRISKMQFGREDSLDQ